MRVLIAVADEQFGTAIVDFVKRHKWAAGTAFRVLHIMEWVPPERELLKNQSMTQYLEQRHQYAVKVTTRVAQQLLDNVKDVVIEEVIMEGSPVQRIIASASAWPADMIIMGSHGRRGISLFVLGSVSLGVVSNAPCSVVVIRLPAAEHTEEMIPSTSSRSIVGRQ